MKNWTSIRKEKKGVVPDKNWVTDGESLALYKPDTQRKESIVEYEAYKIASALGIPCAKTELISLFGTEGCLSYNFKAFDPSREYVPPATIHTNTNGEITFHSKNFDSIPNYKLAMSFEKVKEKFPEVERDVVDMLFVDCLICNMDRHGNNWELIKDIASNKIVGMAPLFDHGLSMWNSFSDNSRLAWCDNETIIDHYEMFGRLSVDYPEQIKDLLAKCAPIELNDYVKPRYHLMRDIFVLSKQSPTQIAVNL
jgi:hypothetical protein